MTLFAPDGNVLRVRTEEHWPPEFMQMLAVFALSCSDTHLGVFCEQCQQTLQGSNARSDNYWKMECACRTYLGRNPLSTRQRQES